MLVKKGVFEALQYPYFEALPFDFGDGIFEYTSEDIGFCLKAKKQGFNVIVNPNIIVGHEKMIIL
jgi:GT2 family glycosyltransferase